ncbi:hypothetical protein LJ739_02620 [Aestuariibacter halophilus]|uniref:Decarbamoylnovobiocin carbamoyltransferase n=1 Tax=Fluctibacter halophilus TaxID=226011 RepID=A0ABS8G7D2_9ALTE|nr:carbamoyltransferase N-terminal domain-containing protein [Aestuariibacter halophilus]MCC2615136.1 hypothetical protein [Aestuariibacter halophilus]
MRVLGLSAFYHDSAAALIENGKILAAVQEERFTRKKFDAALPVSAIQYCLDSAGISVADVDAVVFYDNPALTLDRVIQNRITSGSCSNETFVHSINAMTSHRLWVEKRLRHSFGKLGKADTLYYCDHHMSHAASAFYASAFNTAAIITLDGVGEWATTSLGTGSGNSVTLQKKINYPDSLGLMYSAFTAYCGFKVNSGEYKLMGLASYGRPIYAEKIKQHIITLNPDGSFRINLDYFSYHQTSTMYNDKFVELFGAPPRDPDDEVDLFYADIAASVQAVTEEAVLSIAAWWQAQTGEENLVMAGGVALNCVANGKLLKSGVFKNIWIQPAAGDAGGALGAALAGYYGFLDQPRETSGQDVQQGSLLGPQYCTKDIQHYLDEKGATYQIIDQASTLFDLIARALDEGKVVGHFAGRMEYGPRALGNRSIIGDARRADTQSRMNLKIKFRESFRPFAPSVLLEDVNHYFDLNSPSPYMLLVADVNEDRQLPFDLAAQKASAKNIIDIVNLPRSDIPAITHVDYSARIQTVDPRENARYHDIISAFKARTGYGVIVNTSFNVRGEPIVCSPADAFECFMQTDIDLLVLENVVIDKTSVGLTPIKGGAKDGDDLVVSNAQLQVSPAVNKLLKTIELIPAMTNAKSADRSDSSYVNYDITTSNETGIYPLDLSTPASLERMLFKLWMKNGNMDLAAKADEIARDIFACADELNAKSEASSIETTVPAFTYTF